MERHRNDGVVRLVARQGACEQRRERTRQGLHLPVLIEMNELTQHAFVRAEGVGGIEAAQTGAA